MWVELGFCFGVQGITEASGFVTASGPGAGGQGLEMEQGGGVSLS